MRKMTETQRIAEKQELMKIFDNNEALVDSIIADRDGVPQVRSISHNSLSKEDSLRIAKQICPDYKEQEQEKQITKDECSNIADMINADTKAILKHPELGEYQAMEREQFMKGN